MTTKPPSPVQGTPADSLENIAYNSVGAVPTQEPNDRNRLGYHVWRWLRTKEGTLEQAIAESGARLNITRQEALKTVREALAQHGISAD